MSSKSRKQQAPKQPRKAAVQKAQDRKSTATAAGREAGAKVLVAAVMEQVNQSLERFRAGVANDFQQIMRLVQNCFQNQQALGKSAQDNDDQFAVLLRLTVSRFNMLIGLQNRIFLASVAELSEDKRPANPHEHLVPEVTYEEIQQMFMEYETFKQRPDFRDHFRAWYSGADMKHALPPLPAVEVKEGPLAAPSAPEVEPEAPFPEGAQIFGGDYGSTRGNGAEEAQAQRTTDETGHQDSVPQLRELEDGVENAAENDQNGPLVPVVQHVVHNDEAR
jgi:hypothetical protein